MIQKAIPAIYLAYANHNRKKKGIQHLKDLHEALSPILIPVEDENYISLDREDWDDKPFAYELFQEGHAFPLLSLIHLVVEGEEEDENWYLNAPAGKRQTIDWDSLFFDHLKDLKVIFVDGGNSLEVVEKLLFAGTPAVISTDFSPENEIANQFKLSFYHKLIQGFTLEKAFEMAAEPYGPLFTSKKIASDPYEYWEAKENEDQGDFVSGLYYLSASENVLDWQLIESGLVVPPPLDIKPIVIPQNVEEDHSEDTDAGLTVFESESMDSAETVSEEVDNAQGIEKEPIPEITAEELAPAISDNVIANSDVPEEVEEALDKSEVEKAVFEEEIPIEREENEALTPDAEVNPDTTFTEGISAMEDPDNHTNVEPEEAVLEVNTIFEDETTEIEASVAEMSEEASSIESEEAKSGLIHLENGVETSVNLEEQELEEVDEINEEVEQLTQRVFHLGGEMLSDSNEVAENEKEESEQSISPLASGEKPVEKAEAEEEQAELPADTTTTINSIEEPEEQSEETEFQIEEKRQAILLKEEETEPEIEMTEAVVSESKEAENEFSDWLADALDEEETHEIGPLENESESIPESIEVGTPFYQPVMKEEVASEVVDEEKEMVEEVNEEAEVENTDAEDARELTYVSTLDILELPKAQFFYDIRAHEIDMIHERSISWRLAENLVDTEDLSEDEEEDEPEEPEALETPEREVDVPINRPPEDPISQIVLEEMHTPNEGIVVRQAKDPNVTTETNKEETGLSVPSQLNQSSPPPGTHGPRNQSVSQVGNTGNANLGWKSITGMGLGFLSIVAVVLLFIYQDTEEYPITEEETYLTAFESSQSFNILLLPFKQYPNCYAPEAIDESAVRDRLKILKESEDMGIKVAFINEAACPQSSEEAKRIGEVYNADLVVWGNYTMARQDTNNIHVRYVALGRDQTPSQNYWANLGKLALSDVFELQEGRIGGSVEDVIYWLLGIVHLKNEKYQSALTYLKQIQFQLTPEFSSVHHMIAKCYQGLERYDQVLEAYNTAIELNPNDANGYYNRGAVYQILRQNDQALADYLEAIRINPRHIKAHYNRKLIADGSVEEDLYIDPQLVEQQLPEIREPEAFAREIEAEKEAVARVATNPAASPAPETEATLAVQTEFEEEPAEETESGPAVTYHNLGYQYEQKGQLNEAIYAYTRAIQTDPGQIKSVYSRAALYEKMGKFQQALEDYTAAIQLDSRNLDLYYSRAYLYERMKKYYEAISDYSKIIQLNDRLSNPYLYRGKAYQYVKQNEKALQDFEQAITLNPENATCYFFRARLRQDIGKQKAALEDYNRAIEINQGYASAYRERGELLAHFKKFDEALADFDQVLKSNPHDARIYAKRGDVLIQLGQLGKAEADIREAIKLDPQNQRYQELLAQINSN